MPMEHLRETNIEVVAHSKSISRVIHAGSGGGSLSNGSANASISGEKKAVEGSDQDTLSVDIVI